MIAAAFGRATAAGGFAGMAAGLFSVPALAQQGPDGGVVGYAQPWQTGLQEAATPTMIDLIWFHNGLLLPIIAAISLFVLALLVWCIVRFNERANPVPSRTTHNTPIEVVWTIVPILILAVIAIPSFRLLAEQRTIPEGDVVVKVTGHQWYWSYEYPDEEGIAFDSLMVEEADLKPGEPRLLKVDNELVVPVGKVVRLLVTASDVIHSWTIPSFGVKIDSIPGRVNDAWFRADVPGTYYGQCSELCGQRHAFMPIEVRAVSEDEYAAWLEEAKARFAGRSGPDRARRLVQLAD